MKQPWPKAEPIRNTRRKCYRIGDEAAQTSPFSKSKTRKREAELKEMSMEILIVRLAALAHTGCRGRF